MNEDLLEDIKRVLASAWENGVYLQADLARLKAKAVAFCANEGYITVLDTEGNVMNKWLITQEGLSQLYMLTGAIQ